jgi:hypothetical protein
MWMALWLLLGAITPAQTQARSKTLRAIDHARGLEDWCAKAKADGRPGYLAPARSELAALQKDLERLEGLVAQLEAQGPTIEAPVEP